MPRATTAAWLVMPPRAVRMPWATAMPPMSSGLVSMRTRMTFLPCLAQLSAVVGVEDHLAAGAAGAGGQALGQDAAGLLGRGLFLAVEHGCEELVELAGGHARDGRLPW